MGGEDSISIATKGTAGFGPGSEVDGSTKSLGSGFIRSGGAALVSVGSRFRTWTGAGAGA